ncbi:MAG: hypothetical protein IKV21_04265, partial [Clostridia bacterium]|nr:hypothetical protein [Clostridia bacterium]
TVGLEDIGVNRTLCEEGNAFQLGSFFIKDLDEFAADDLTLAFGFFNTGKQIPGTDIENIWQSFYRADKSHSRAEGRFGLGLSIVAKLQDLHSQKYGVINKEKGVEFWFDIEKTEKRR